MNKLITTAILKSHHACDEQVQLFDQLTGGSIELTEDWCLEHAAQFDWHWAARNLLSATARTECDRATAPARAELDRATATAWAERDRATATAQAECDRATAWAEYDRAIAPAWAEYDRARATAFWNLYDSTKVPT